IPAANGITNARSLALLYAACIGEVDGVRLLQPKTVEAATRVQSAGEDLVLGYETRYATGFQLSFPFRPMAGEGSFGHYGMGGSLGIHGFGIGVGLATLVGVVAGVIGAGVVLMAFRFLRQAESTDTFSLEDMVGSTGRVSVGIPANRFGSVLISFAGASHN